MTENKESNPPKTANDNRIYETGYLVLPIIPEDKIEGVVAGVKGILERAGASLISEDFPHVIRLAYTMEKVIENKKQKFDTAYFGWVKFELDPEKIGEVEKALKTIRELLRFMVVKTVRENTLISRHPAAPVWTKKKEKTEDAKPLSDTAVASIDKKIEELTI